MLHLLNVATAKCCNCCSHLLLLLVATDLMPLWLNNVADCHLFLLFLLASDACADFTAVLTNYSVIPTCHDHEHWLHQSFTPHYCCALMVPLLLQRCITCRHVLMALAALLLLFLHPDAVCCWKGAFACAFLLQLLACCSPQAATTCCSALLLSL